MDVKELLLTTCMSVQQYSACLWDSMSTNTIQHYKNGGRAAAKGLALLNQDYIIMADADKPLISTWVLNSQEPVKDLKLVLPGQATCIAVCPYGIYLAVGISAKLYIWHLSSGKLLTVQEKHYQPISVIKFSSDSVYLAVGGSDGTLVTYNFADLVSLQNNLFAQSDAGQVEALYSRTDHSREITDIFLGNFGGKSRIATVSSDNSCLIYNLAMGELLLNLVFPEELTSVVFNTISWCVYVGTISGRIYQYNLTIPHKEIRRNVNTDDSLTFIGHKQKITCLAINLDSTILVSGSADCLVNIWEIRSRKILKTLEHKGLVTNILFVLNHDKFFSQIYKPCTVVKKLERTFEPSDQMEVCVNQTEDLVIDEEISDRNKVELLVRENRYLRAANKQLYEANIIKLNKKRKLVS